MITTAVENSLIKTIGYSWPGIAETITFEPADIDRFQTLQWDYARLLVNRPWQETAQLLVVPTN